MVFESLVVSVLNHFLGPYVKNLNASQLKLGIWNGDALLERLEIKENAFSQFDLPVRVKGGFLNRLRLQIPWKSKFTDPVIAEVEGLYLIASPLSAAPYDSKKETKEARENKQNQLKKIEEAKKREKEAKAKSDDGFVAKLVTQIIKNIQITVKDIHVRYEDEVTLPGHTFAAGVTLEGLIIQSTDSKWKIGLNKEEGELIYKIVQLKSLSVYWDSDTQLFGDLPSSEWMKHLKARISTATNRPDGTSYVLKPLTAQAKVVLTTKPGKDPNIPQANVNIIINEVALHLDQLQFQGLISFAESLDRMSINARYRKYKTAVKRKGSYKLWWKYAIVSVLEEHVKRKTQMWSPTHMKQHWKLFKCYIERYTEKLLTASPSVELLSQLEQLEDQLSVGNIVVARNEAELQASKVTKQRAEAKAASGWFSWFTTTVVEEKDQSSVIPSEEEMDAERESLYKAIGYAKGEALVSFAKEYVAHKIDFCLNKVTVELYNGADRAGLVEVIQVEARLAHRPSAKGISVAAIVGDVNARGIDGNDQPLIIESTSKSTGKDSFIDVTFEMNPLDIAAENSIRLLASVKPLRVIYNATTIVNVISIFKLPKHIHLQQVSSSAVQSLKQLRTQTRAGLQHVVTHRRVYDINIKLESPYVILPENGLLRSSSSVLVVDLGCLVVTSDTQHHLPTEESVKNASLEELSEAFYDKFDLKLNNVQIIVAGKGDDWEEARKNFQSQFHVLERVAIDLKLRKSLLSNDTRLPALIVEGKLPDLHLSLSDKKLEQLIKIALSIPVPPPVVEADPDAVTVKGVDLMLEIPSNVDLSDLVHETVSSEEDQSDSEEYATASEGEDETAKDSHLGDRQLPSSTELLLKIELGRVGISFDQWKEGTAEDAHVLGLELNLIEAEFRKQTWDDVAVVTVAKISILSHLIDGPPKPILANEVADSSFVTVNYCKANQSGPQFKSYYQSTRQSVTVLLSRLRVNVHEEALPKLINIFQTMGDNINQMLKEREDKFGSSQPIISQPTVSVTGTSVDMEVVSQVEQSGSSDGVTDVHFVGKFGGFAAALESPGQKHVLLLASLKDVDVDVMINTCQVVVTASVSDVSLEDPVSSAPYNMVVAKSDQSEHIISAKIIVYKEPIKGEAVNDLSKANLAVQARVSQLQVIVVFPLIKKMIDFVTNLQINRKLLQSAGKIASDQVSKAANAIRERNTSRVKLDMSLNAPLIIIPANTTSDSSDIFVINLGQLQAANKFIMGSEYSNETDPSQLISSSGEPAVMDKLSLTVTSVKIYRVNSFESIMSTSEKKTVLIKLAECSAGVIRNLSPWCKPLPLLDVSLQLDTISVYFTPDTYHAAMRVVDSAKVLTTATTSSTTSLTGEGDNDGGTVAGKTDGAKEMKSGDNQSGIGGRIVVHAEAAGVSLLLNLDEEHSLAAVKVKGLSVDAVLDDTTIGVTATLKAINVSNLAYHSLFPLIVYSEEAEKMLFVKIVLYRDVSTLQDIDPEISITAKVQRINVIVLYQFIKAVQDLVDKLHFSKKAVVEAKDTARETVDVAVKSVRRNAMRVKFDVDVRAPQILIPLNSVKREGFVVDLGRVKISNSFQVQPETASLETKAILDIITVDLSGLAVFRFVYGKLLCKHLYLLKQLKMEIVVERNLSSWFKGAPLIDVRLYLHPLKANISDNDLSMLLKVLQHNLGEGKELQRAVEATVDKDNVFVETKDPSASADEVLIGGSAEEDTHCVVAVSLLVDSISVQLFHKAVPLRVSKIHGWKRKDRLALANVGVNTFEAKMSLLSDKSLQLNLSLFSLSIEDSREGNDDRISMMFCNHRVGNLSLPDANNYKMVEMSVIRDKWNRLTVMTKLNYMQLLLDVNFLFNLLDFAKRSFISDERKPSSDVVKTPHQPKQQRTQQLAKGDTLQINVELKEPRISLLEDASKPNSRTIVLQSEFQLVFSMTENGRKLGIVGKDMKISLARYTNMIQPESIIMAPCNMDFLLTDSPEKTDGYLEITESVDLVLSPTTVRLLLYVARSVPKDEGSTDDGENIPMSFWDPKSLDKGKWYFTAADTLFDAHHIVEPSVDAPPTPKKESMVVTIKQLKIVLEKELLDEARTVPLILFTGKLDNKDDANSAIDKDPSVYEHPVYISVVNWTGNLSAAATVRLRGSYYNERLDVMEPLLEPIERVDHTYRLWELKLEANRLVDFNEFLSKERKRRSESLSDERIIYPSSLPPEWSLDITSKHNLQLTLTKTSLEILSELQKSYFDMTLMGVTDSIDFAEESHPAAYLVVNKLGEGSTVNVVPKGNLKLSMAGMEEGVIRNNASLPLEYKTLTEHVSAVDIMDSAVQQQLDFTEITVEGFHPLKIHLTGNRLRYYELKPLLEESPVINYGLVVEIDRHKETKRVTLKSPVAVYNHLGVACLVFTCKSPSPKQQTELEKIGQVNTNQSLSVPLITAHKGYVFITPLKMGVYVSSQGIHWTKHEDIFNLSCQPYAEDKEYFYIRVRPEAQKSLESHKLRMEKRPHHVYHLHYPVAFYNMLPITAAVATSNKRDAGTELSSGKHQNYSNIDITKPCTFTITYDSGDITWRGSLKVYEKMETDDIVVFNSDKKVDNKSLEKVFSINVNRDEGYLKILFHAKYWVTNKTDRTLQYTGYELSTITHPCDEEVKFFSMKKKHSTESEFIIRMVLPDKETTKWSKVIPLAAAGTSGTFTVESNDNRRHELGVKVQLSRFGLSMIVIITPLYVLRNDTTHVVRVHEDGLDNSITLPPKSTVPFWPVDTASCKLSISINDSHKTSSFSILETDTVLLKVEGESTSAVVMDVNVTELCKVVTFKPLFSGSIPCVMVNHFSHQSIMFKQNIEDGSDGRQLHAGQCTVFTWSDPCKKRELVWWLDGKMDSKHIITMKTDHGTFEVEDTPDVEGSDQSDEEARDQVKAGGIESSVDPQLKGGRKFSLTSQVKMLAHKTKHAMKVKRRQEEIDTDKGGYWVSFLDGLQRVIIFTPDPYVYKISQHPSLVERTTAQLTASLVAMGLSLVNDIDGRDVAYLGLTGSQIVWEYQKRRNKWVAVSQEHVEILEEFYKKLSNKEEIKFPVPLDKDIEADLEKMILTIGKKTHKLRRTFYEGFWAQAALSKSETKLSARIGTIQLDNQLFNPIFDNVFHAVPPVNEIARKYPPKPFFDVSAVIGPTEHSGAMQYQYFELLIQKMAFNLDLNFLFALLDLFTGFIKKEQISEFKLNELDRADLKLSLQNVVYHREARHIVSSYFGVFKIHPLSIILSLNFSYTDSDQQKYSLFGPIFNMLKSFGASFITTDDISLQLSMLLVENKVMTQHKMIEKIKQHYIQGGIGQAYKIVLGLDVLGNPVGFVTGLASGTKGLFYEPFEGALLGPEEFVQGLGQGVHGFVGATIGGVADSAGKIADTVGSAAVSLVLTEEEKRKREATRRGGGIISGLGHFTSDLVGGVTGVVSKPVTGAKEGGIAGFFTGAGRGVAGLFLRPIGGTFDLLNVALDSVKKVTTRGDYDISQLRPSRCFGIDGVMQVYSYHLATGNAAFLQLDKFTDTDMYFNHVVLKPNPLTFLIVTTNRFMIISKSSLTGGWQVDHVGVQFAEMMSSAKVDENTVTITVATGRDSGLHGIASRIGWGITGSVKSQIKSKTKTFQLPSKEIAKEAAKIINEASKVDF